MSHPPATPRPGRQTGEEAADPVARLEAERARLADRVAVCEQGLREAAARAEPEGRDDEHDPDGDSAAFEQALAVGLLERARHDLAEADAAVVRARAGRYGRCQACGAPIPAERLAAQPATLRCVECAAAAATTRRPPRPPGRR